MKKQERIFIMFLVLFIALMVLGLLMGTGLLGPSIIQVRQTQYAATATYGAEQYRLQLTALAK